MTKVELEAKGIIRSCKKDFDLLHKAVPTYNVGTDNFFDLNKHYTFEQQRLIWNATSCREDSDKVIADYKKAINPAPARDWYERADDEQYKFCLHDKGL